MTYFEVSVFHKFLGSTWVNELLIRSFIDHLTDSVFAIFKAGGS